MSSRSCAVRLVLSAVCEPTEFMTPVSPAAVLTLLSLALPRPWQPEQLLAYLVRPAATLPTGVTTGGVTGGGFTTGDGGAGGAVVVQLAAADLTTVVAWHMTETDPLVPPALNVSVVLP